jgi:hypothetical protein
MYYEVYYGNSFVLESLPKLVDGLIDIIVSFQHVSSVFGMDKFLICVHSLYEFSRSFYK